MKVPPLKEWREGCVQIGLFVRTATGMTAEYRSRLITPSNRFAVASTIARFLMESPELATDVAEVIQTLRSEGSNADA